MNVSSNAYIAALTHSTDIRPLIHPYPCYRRFYDTSKRIRAHRTHGRLAAITIIPTAQQRAASVWNKTNDTQTHTLEYTIIILRSVHDVIAAFPVTGASNREIQRAP